MGRLAGHRRAGDLREAIEGIATETVVVDLGGVRFLDSEALAGLIEGFLRARESGVAIRAVPARGIVLKVLEVTGTLELLGAA